MPDRSFLDSGVVLGFAFTTDKHHKNCREYLESAEDGTVFVSNRVKEEYRDKEPHLADAHSEAVLEHIKDLKGSNFEGQLGPQDIKDIRESVLDPQNRAYDYLYWFYYREVSKFLPLNRLISQLQEIARSIDTLAAERRAELEKRLTVWVREREDYEALDGLLSSIHDQDRQICIDAHDLAVHKQGETEIATTNPNDFVRNGYKSLILEETELSDVVSLAA